MARTFKHILVTYTREVTEQQVVDIAVDAALSPETAVTMARELAVGRIKDTGWKPEKVGTAELLSAVAA